MIQSFVRYWTISWLTTPHNKTFFTAFPFAPQLLTAPLVPQHKQEVKISRTKTLLDVPEIPLARPHKIYVTVRISYFVLRGQRLLASARTLRWTAVEIGLCCTAQGEELSKTVPATDTLDNLSENLSSGHFGDALHRWICAYRPLSGELL